MGRIESCDHGHTERGVYDPQQPPVQNCRVAPGRKRACLLVFREKKQNKKGQNDRETRRHDEQQRAAHTQLTTATVAAVPSPLIPRRRLLSKYVVAGREAR